MIFIAYLTTKDPFIVGILAFSKKYFVVSLIPPPSRVDSPARTTKTETPAYVKLPTDICY